MALLRRAGLLLCVCVSWLPARCARAQDLSGYVKNFSLGFELPDSLAADNFLWQSSNRLRIKYKQTLGRSHTLEGAYEALPRFQSRDFYGTLIFPFSVNPSSYRVADIRAQVYPRSNRTPGRFGLFQNLDRMSLFWKTSKADIIVGRQPIAWGSARVVNPTDIIAPFAFNDIDKEEVFGVDAVRVRIPTGNLSEVDLGYLPGRDFRFSRSAFFARGRTSLLHTDASIMAIGFQRNLLIGTDLSRALGPAGMNFDAAYVVVGALGEAPAPGNNYLRLSVGVDGNPAPRLYMYAEYHYSSAGGRTPGEYLTLFQTSAYQQGNVYLLGRHYVSAGGNLQVTPLNTFTWLVMGNLGDRSVNIWPSWEYNLTANTYLSLGANLVMGKSPVTPPGSSAPVFRSEFGAYPRVLYISYRFYF